MTLEENHLHRSGETRDGEGKQGRNDDGGESHDCKYEKGTRKALCWITGL